MCGRYGLYRDPRPFARKLRASVAADFSFEPHYNVTPQTPVPAIVNDPACGLTNLRWGLIANKSTFNARIETLATSPLYGPLLPFSRCIVPADGYYEWRRLSDGTKAPVWIYRSDGEPIAFAGLWDAGACTIVTQPPNARLAVVHDRMPVVLDEAAALAWLAPGELDPDAALALLRPVQGDELAYHPVARDVGNVRNDRPGLITPVAEPLPQPSLFDARTLTDGT
jgi:putative SOS response-associated peptidase YedK